MVVGSYKTVLEVEGDKFMLVYHYVGGFGFQLPARCWGREFTLVEQLSILPTAVRSDC